MPRNSRWKLAIVTGIAECLVYAEAKYCAFEIHGEPKYYVCPKTEYCCNFGCCVSPGFQIYHLWYYWLLVIIMFLVCSGGGWWYRYWLQGRYRAATSAIPTRSPNSRSQSSLRGSACQAQQARISYNTARNTVLLHRMWKGPQRGSVAYGAGLAGASAAAAAASSGAAHHYQNTSVLLNDVGCPYYQLYGPPPSYETVIAQSRAAAAAKQLQQQQQQQQQTDGTTPDASTTTSTNPVSTEESCCVSRFSSQDGRCPEMVMPRLPSYYYGSEETPGFVAPITAPSVGWQGWYTRLGMRDNGLGCSSQLEPCGVAIQQQAHLVHQQQMALAEEAESNLNQSLGAAGHSASRTLPHSSAAEGASCRVPGVHRNSRSKRAKVESASSSTSELLNDQTPTASTSIPIESCCSTAPSTSSRRPQGGSLKMPRRRDIVRQQQQQQQQQQQARLSLADHQQQQPSPSSNVISSQPVASTNAKAESVGNSTSRPRVGQSKRKLDRSRSLE